MRYEVGELKAGEILDQAIWLVKNHFWLFCRIMILPVLLIGAAIEARQMGETSMFLPVATVLTLGPLYGLATIHAAAACYLGKPVTVRSAYWRGLGAWLPCLWTALGYFFGIAALNMAFGFSIALVVSLGGLAGTGYRALEFVGVGIILVIWLGLLVLQWLFNLHFLLAVQLVVIERVFGLKAILRSFRLMKGSLRSAMLLSLIMLPISWSAMFSEIFIPYGLLRLVCLVLLTGLIANLLAAAWVVFYYSCRSRVESLHLFLLADSVGVDDRPVEATLVAGPTL